MAAVKVDNTVRVIAECVESLGRLPAQMPWFTRNFCTQKYHKVQAKQDCRHVEYKGSTSGLICTKNRGKFLSLQHRQHTEMLPSQNQEGRSTEEARHGLIFLLYKRGEHKGPPSALSWWGEEHIPSLSVSAGASNGAMKLFIFCPKFLLSSKTEQWMGIQFSWERNLI